jgi:glycosyltransferase involved in cell wall biosynthesis
MKIAIIKPDWRIVGGFELLVQRIASELEMLGHEVSWRHIDVPSVSRSPFGVVVRDELWAAAPEYFRYVALLERVLDLDVPDADVVLSTQPPSFAVRHPRQLSLFFHHLRIYYDLSEVYLAAGFVEPHLHLEAQRHVRRIDEVHLANVTRFLVASNEVHSRLTGYHDFEAPISTLKIGITREWAGAGGNNERHVLCVSRHEFPKRTELFVLAMLLSEHLRAVMVGAGGRLARVQWLHREVLEGRIDAAALGDLDTWCNTGLADADPADVTERQPGRGVRFLQGVEDRDLLELYQSALCVVAPAFREDYGLTALEAMRLGVPVVVCRDGGGLTELVEHGVSGLVVDPTPMAISDAVNTIAASPELRRTMGENGREIAARYNWSATRSQLAAALSDVSA